MALATPIDPQRIQALAAGFSGALIGPEDAGFEEARRIHNGLIDKRPALIARCRGTSDVQAALAFARENGLDVAIRGGGHNVAGRAVCDGGLVIDLSDMKAITVDAEARTLRAGGGVLWSELNDAAAAHGLAVTGGMISTTGIAGLTLGGGIGWLMGVHGLSVDNLLSVELVTAAGDVLTVAEDSHPDLFWALRGGGGNFGVATAFEFRLHPLREVVGGLVAHPLDAAGDVLRFYRDFTREVPDELTALGALVHAPDGSGVPLAAFAVCHAGPREQAEADLAPLLAFGSPAMTQVGPMPYPAVNRMLDAGYPRGALNYWKASFVTGLDDELIDTAIERFAACPSPMGALVLEHFHGAVTRVPVEATAVPHREEGYNLVITGVWTDPAETAANIEWTRGTYAAVAPHFAARRYVNYLADDEGDDAVAAAYGANYARLQELKRRYDPDNLFHLNHNVRITA
jgi:FAD/FMN-containing dehydrogenase